MLPAKTFKAWTDIPLQINNIIFTHGGVSEDFIAYRVFNLEKINDIMRNSIPQSRKDTKSNEFNRMYYGTKSLIWYRGYFEENFTYTDISKILKYIFHLFSLI